MKTHLITGGAGFIGSRLAWRLCAEGHKVYILDDLSTGFLRNLPQEAVFFPADISKPGFMTKVRIPEPLDTVFHFAAQSSGEASFDNPGRDVDVNYRATYHILRFADKMRAKRFLYASSMSVYGDVGGDVHAVAEDHPCEPASYYGCNKLASEKLIAVYARRSCLKPTIFRFFNVYGPGQNMTNMKQGMVSIYLSYLMKDMPIEVKGGLGRFRDFIFIEDLLDVVIKSENDPATWNQVYNVGTGKKTTVADLLKALLDTYDKDDFDHWVKAGRETPGDVQGFCADIAKVREALGWSPRYDLREGLEAMKKWLDQTKEWW